MTSTVRRIVFVVSRHLAGVLQRGFARAIAAREYRDMIWARIHGTRLVLSAAIALTVALTIGMLGAGRMAMAAGPPPVGLGTAANFAILAGTPSIENTGPTVVTGDVGIDPGAAVNGFGGPPNGTVIGTIHADNVVAEQAKSDLVTAYDVAASAPVTATHGGLGGLTLVGGVYNSGPPTLDLTGTLTLDGQNDPSSVWIFQATSDLVTASSSSVSLVNGAQACNVFWQVSSSATLGSGSTFVGTIMALASITVADSVTVNGRLLAREGTVTLINDTITRSTCATTAAPAATATPIPLLPNAAYLDDGAAVSPGSLLVAIGVGAFVLALVMVTRIRSATVKSRPPRHQP